MPTLSAKEAAIELGTDARTFRKFMRAITPKEDQPGQGNRYAIEAKDIKKLKKQYADWAAPKAAKAESNGKKAKGEEVIDLDEELDDLDLDPDDDDILTLVEDDDPDLEEDIEELT